MLKTVFATVAFGFAAMAQAASSPGIGYSFVTDLDYPVYGYVSTAGAQNINWSNNEFSTGFIEFSLAGVAKGQQDLVSFSLLSKGYTTPGATGAPGGVFTLNAFGGTGVPDKSAYTLPSYATLGSFDLAATNIGDVLSYDVSAWVDRAIDAGAATLGVHFVGQGAFTSAPYGEYATFGSATLTTADAAVVAVPEPSTYALMGVGLLVLGAVRRSVRRQ